MNFTTRKFSMEGQFKTKLEVPVNHTNPKWILYKFPLDTKIKFLRIEFELKLKLNQTVIIKSQSDNSKFKLENKYSKPIVKIEKTICLISQKNESNMDEILALKATTESSETISINVTAMFDEKFTINVGENRNITIGENSPAYWILKFNDTNVNMEMRIKSDDNNCMYAFIEKAECSLNILNPQPERAYVKKIIKRGSIPIKNYRGYQNSSLFVVFLLTENKNCKGNSINHNFSNGKIFRKKSFNISFKKNDLYYKIHIIGLFWIFVSFAVIYIWIYHRYFRCLGFNPDNKGQSNSFGNIIVEKNFEKHSNSPQGFRIKHYLNFKFLYGISVFYGLPVIELFWHFVKVMNDHKYLDKCSFNYHCNKPWKSINSINNVMSNMGFIILGIAFMIIVTINRSFIIKNSLNSPNYGIFYALGLLFIMQGVSSACYHICPCYDTVQFDASFIISFGCLLTLYFGIQFLKEFHENELNIDENIKQYFTFMSTVRLIMTYLLSIEHTIPTLMKWIMVSIFQLIVIISSLYKIFNSPDVKWRNIFCFRKICSIAILFVNILFGYISFNGSFFSYFITLIFANCCVLMIFYYFNTLKNTLGSILEIPYLCRNNKFIFMTIVGWIFYSSFALKLFFLAPPDWQAIIRESREFNSDCIWGAFYDYHDIFHILSSTAVFLGFMWIFMIDGKILQWKTTRVGLAMPLNNTDEN